MTLGDIEKLATSLVEQAECFREDTMIRRKLESHDDTKLARALLAVMPVARAAEEIRPVIARTPRPSDAEAKIAMAVDRMHDTLRRGVGSR